LEICQNFGASNDLARNNRRLRCYPARSCTGETVNILFVILAILIALLAGYAIGKTHAEIKCLRERIASLEDAQAKHLPYRTNDEIENSIAALLTLKFQQDLKTEFIDNALGHLQNARSGGSK
jgi:hypothetical protein